MSEYKNGSVSVGKAGYFWMEKSDKPEELISDEEELAEYNKAPLVAYLPHQCDAWVIGDASRVRYLIADLQLLLEDLEK